MRAIVSLVEPLRVASDAYGVMVFAIQGDRIAGITGFSHDLETFTQLGLPHS